MRLVLWLLLVVGSACPPPNGDPPPKLKPQVSLTVQSASVIGSAINGSVTASGRGLTRVELLGPDQAFILDSRSSANPTTWQIDTQSLKRFYAERGIALTVSLFARVTCLEDARTNLSQWVSVSFFPVASVVSEPRCRSSPIASSPSAASPEPPPTSSGAAAATS